MAKQSAGILLYKLAENKPQFLIVHPGGPFWAKKDKGAWSIPKGEFEDGDDPLIAAKREYNEELGAQAPGGDYIDLGQVKLKSGKIIHAWACEGNYNVNTLNSNTFEMKWPPKSGKTQVFPEVDRAGWFEAEKAKLKLNPSLTEFIDRLMDLKGFDEPDNSNQQLSLI